MDKIKCFCKRSLTLGVAFQSAMLFAGTSIWQGGAAGGWNAEGNWSSGGVPDASSTVEVPSGVDIVIADADAALAGAVETIHLSDTNSRAIFNLESETCTMSGTITGNGRIVKNGEGMLKLTNEAVDGYYAQGGMEVNGGIVECPTTFASTWSTTRMNIGPLHVAEGAKFRPYAKYRTTVVTSLTGNGQVCNEVGGGFWPFMIASSKLCQFNGRIGGYLRLQIAGPIDLLSSTSFFQGEFYVDSNGADVGFAKLGKSTSVEDSSIGRTAYNSSGVLTRRPIIVDAGPGRMRYLGTGESSDRDIRFDSRTGLIMDAGATGGLCLNGQVYSTVAGHFVLCLSGSNTVDSTLACKWDEFADSSIYLAKQGLGAWRLAGVPESRQTGVVGVEEGTLKFYSLAETNVPCSFGLSTRLMKKRMGPWEESMKADYAILLGSEYAEGCLEYIGTNLWDNAASTRPIAVTGKGGRIVVDGENRMFGLKGVFAADANGSTLTLDGSGSHNYLYNVEDGHGTLSVVKEGSGTWTLAGDQSFSGRLVVNAGVLVVSSVCGTKYSWYRLTLKGCGSESANERAQLRELGLYDALGRRLNKSLVPTNGDMKIPKPGEASIWQNQVSYGTAGSIVQDVTWLFDGTGTFNAENKYFICKCANAQPRTDRPDTWIPIVMRLDDSSDEVASWDAVTAESCQHRYTPTSWTMEASTDGLFWDKVSATADQGGTDVNVASGSSKWMHDTGSVNPANHKGFEFGLDKGRSLIAMESNQLANATISVDAGAVLRAEGIVTINNISVNLGGAGTIDGFNIGRDGILNVDGHISGAGDVELPITFANVSGAENFDTWNVRLGSRRSSARLRYSDGKLFVERPGMFLLLH